MNIYTTYYTVSLDSSWQLIHIFGGINKFVLTCILFKKL